VTCTQTVSFLVEHEEAPVPLELPFIVRRHERAGRLEKELVVAGVEDSREDAGDGGRLWIAEVDSKRAHHANQKPRGRIVADRGEDGGENLERLRGRLGFLFQANHLKEIRPVLILAALRVYANRAVTLPVDAFPVIGTGYR